MTAVDDRSDLADPAWAGPESELVLPPHPDREEWLSARRAGMGGSDVSAVFGLNAYSSPIGVWLAKTGREPEPDPDPEWPGAAPSEAAHWGNLFEATVRDEWSRRTRIPVAAAGMQRSRRHPHMLYTPDARGGDGSLVEVKTTTLWRRDEWGRDQAPDHAEIQVQHGMAVTGASHAWIMGLIGGQELVWRRIPRDEDVIADLVRFETWWWESYVVADVMPPVDGTDATNDVVKGWVGDAEPGKVLVADRELITLWRDLGAAKDDADLVAARVTELDSRIRLAVGDAELVVLDAAGPTAGSSKAAKRNVLASNRNDATPSAKRLAAARPDLVDVYTKTTTSPDWAALKESEPDAYRASRSRVLRPKRAALDAALEELDAVEAAERDAAAAAAAEHDDDAQADAPDRHDTTTGDNDG